MGLKEELERLAGGSAPAKRMVDPEDAIGGMDAFTKDRLVGGGVR